MDKKLLWTKKIIIYCLGVFILAMGVSFSIKSNLGEIQGVCEGTAIAAFGVGLVMKPLEKNIKYAVIKVLYGVNHE